MRWLHDSVASAGSDGRGRAWSYQGSFEKSTVAASGESAPRHRCLDIDREFAVFRFSDLLSRSQLFLGFFLTSLDRIGSRGGSDNGPATL